MMMSGNLVKYLFIETETLIVLQLSIEKEVGGTKTVFILLSMRHGVSLKDTRKTLFGMSGKVGMKL